MQSGLNGIKTIEEFDLKNKTLFMRVDFNVPMEEGKIVDDLRITAALPSIQYALDKGAKLILASHLGRPKTDEDRKKLSLEPVAKRLGELLNKEVLLMDSPEGNAPKAILPGLKSSQIIMLENLRFAEGETKNSIELAKQWASYTDVYINDAFGASHRAHASTDALPQLITDKGVGFLIKKEIEMLDKVLYSQEKPFTAVLGGSKVSDKIELIENLIDKVDSFVIGGAMAYTFLAAQGIAVGSSRIENSKIKLAKELIEKIEFKNKKVILPIDHVIVQELKAGAEHKNTDGPSIADSWMAVDIGPKTRERYAFEVSASKTLLWNGPMGVYEIPPFHEGSYAVAKAFARNEHTTVIGGGDSAAVTKAANLEDKMTHISTGGGASLEYLQGSQLPGLKVLKA